MLPDVQPWRRVTNLSTARVYALTATGRKAFWESQNKTDLLPADYRRILGLVEFQGHSEVIRAYLRRYSDELIDDWLAEMVELGLVDAVPVQPLTKLQFKRSQDATLPPLVEEDKTRLEADTKAAGASLSRSGVYLAEDRLKNLPGPRKATGDTVVLIVEDDPDQLALANMRITMAGYAVRTAESASALLETLQKDGAPDLLLLDVMLPDGDGFDLLADIRRHPRIALLPVVMLTVKSEAEDIRKGLALGADGYVTKPYSKSILAETIRRVLKR
ncbi:MAG TPA: response regulator [Burkholderiales bacterium]|nr:response regulator [Burkholderiales bacterium]